ncbi:MAG TPA: hypothetical protein ENK18_02105 [Deltaproteobacteria bacterium]|nr:hypothetical protein [Deltaproteobacteria bacterium]
MDDPEDLSPTLELVGDWTSARLLVRLLVVIDSPWELSAAGLTHRDTGETCELQMRPRDASMIEVFRAGECPVRPSLSDEVMEGIAGHHSILTVSASPDLRGWEAARTVLRCGSALVDSGALAVRCLQSGLAHAGDRLSTLERMAGAAGDDRALLGESLYLAYVMPLVRDGASPRTRGMALLEAPDAVVVGSVAEPNALDAMESLCLRTLAARAPTSGEVVHASPHSPPFRVERMPDRTDPGSRGYNPFGLWRLEPVSR